MLMTALAGLVGVLLGLLGGGGSILLVPLLIHVAGLNGHAAIRASLLLVGASSMVALVPHALAGQVRWRVGIAFAATGVLGAFAGGKVAAFLPERLLLLGFAVMMAFTGVALFRCRRCDGQGSQPLPSAPSVPVFRLLSKGLAVGAITGLVGVGGGFLIVPTLTLFARLSTRAAVGTSLLVIALNSLAGFVAHTSGPSPEVGLLLPWLIACSLGSIAGSYLSDRVPQRALRRAFSVVVVSAAVFTVATG